MIKISAFPKCYLDDISVNHTMTVFDWIEMAKELGAEGLEMYVGFFPTLDDGFVDSVGEAISKAGFAMPMMCCSPNFTHRDPAVRQREIEKEADMIRVTRRLGGPGLPDRPRGG